uniref:Uncharacterized protein n=1 Tax=Vespula pensylvanica TaxID=30213 RepID=A0A834P074_VESPE|nr:hypothetical protein H0235_008495 [Vespula pensylvanica]
MLKSQDKIYLWLGNAREGFYQAVEASFTIRKTGEEWVRVPKLNALGLGALDATHKRCKPKLNVLRERVLDVTLAERLAGYLIGPP